MSSQGYTPGQSIPTPTNGTASRIAFLFRRKGRPRYWLHAVLLILTLITTAAIGARLAENFRLNRPAINIPGDLGAFSVIWSDPWTLLTGLPFSLTLMTILLAHEFGHFFACRYYRVDATPPYFMPAPTFIGTLGAFIKIRSPIYSREVLFDIGIAGPLAGFVFLVPALAVGLAFSKVVPGIANQGLVFGMPPLIWLLEKVIFPGVAAADIYLHPVARAAWVGIFATALNLLPIGQLDGGHVLYSFVGERHKLLSKVFVLALIPLGRFYWPWLVWAAVLLIFGLRHPPIFDPRRIGPGRKTLGWIALAVFLLCFMITPTSTEP